jgi:hypothetical protein
MTWEFTEKQTIAMSAIQSELYDLIMFGGAIRGGKSFWGLSAFLVLCRIFPNSRWCVIRENIEKIRTTTIPTFKKLMASGHLRESPYEFTHKNGSVILFKGENYAQDKELDWLKGFEANGFLFEEINECQELTLQRAFSRSGSWVIPNNGINPHPIVLATCNPSFGWVKTNIYDKWQSNTLPKKWLFIPSQITDNVNKEGKSNLPQAYLDNLDNLNQYEREVFVKGNWNIQLKTGNEWLKGFELNKHVRKVDYNEDQIIHISIDSNVLPYIAITFWQIKHNSLFWEIKQFHEILAKDPNNTARKAGELAAKYLKYQKYDSKIYLYGDRSTKNRNNIDDDKRSFAEIFKDSLKKQGFAIQDKFLSLAPNVSDIADFLNAIYDGTLTFAKITIGDNCTNSINDYLTTKEDKDGGMIKRRVSDSKTQMSYEENGHLTDTHKDFIVQCFYEEFKKYKHRLQPEVGGVLKVKRGDKVTF